MRDLWSMFRHLPRLEGLGYCFEKAGLVLDNQPIPWCADAVVVQASVEVPPQAAGRADFSLRLGSASLPPESLYPSESDTSLALTFRFPAPAKTSLAELFWRSRSLGQVALPVLSADDFARKLTLQMPTVSVRVGEHTVACRSYVSTQCQGLVVSALVNAAGSLAPIHDLGLRVELRRAEGSVAKTAAVHLSSTQLKARQALASVVFPKPRRGGTWEIVWLLGDRLLNSQSIRAISKQQFLRSLRVSGTRFVLQDADGDMRLERYLGELDDVRRVGPCFLVSSAEPGMAGLCTLQVLAQVKGAVKAPLLQEQEILITDGPCPFMPGTLDIDDLRQVKLFELRAGRDSLGMLPLTQVPTAAFTKEGGFVAPASFEWSAVAEEQLKQRLGRLLDKEKM